MVLPSIVIVGKYSPLEELTVSIFVTVRFFSGSLKSPIILSVLTTSSINHYL